MTIAPGAPIEADDITDLNFRAECIVTRVALQSIASGGVGTAVSFSAESRDNDAMWSAGTTVTIQRDGTYDLAGSFIYAGNVTGVRSINVKKNGVVIAENKRAASTPLQADPMTVNTTDRFVAGDTVTMFAFHTAGVALDVTVSRLSVVEGGSGN